MPSRVVLLHDVHAASGPADASDVLREASHVAGGLERLGYETRTLAVGLDLEALEKSLRALAPLAVFNLMESVEGHGCLIHIVPALLEALGIAYTGCSPLAQWQTSNKLAAKRRLAAAGIAAPALAADGTAGPWIVKSVWEHASLGIDDTSIVRDRGGIAGEIERRRRRFGGDWFAERYVDGRELNVAIIAAPGEARVLPVAEIRFDGFPAGKPRIVGYAAKWHAESFEYARTVRTFDVEEPLAAAARKIALDCWALFELDGYARIDLRVDAGGGLWVLEVNANPCLSADAGFAAMLDAAGVGFDTALGWLLDDALARRRAPDDTNPAAATDPAARATGAGERGASG